MNPTSKPVAVVTGSTAGIGAAVARRLAADGYTVVVNGRSQDRVDAVVESIRASGAEALGAVADLSDPGSIPPLFEHLRDAVGRVDVLVNNAGFATIGASADFPLRRWDRVLALNLTAPFVAAQQAHPMMVESGGGVVINMSSIYGAIAAPMRAAYISSKHGLIGLTKALATEWATDNIRVVSVVPSYIETEVIAASRQAGHFDPAATLARTPLRRLGTVEEVADVVAFAVSDAARYITGSTIHADGGWLAFGGA